MLTISKIYQFFHYEGSSNFTLSNLSSEVKGKINRIFSPNSSGTTVSNWRPTGGSFQTLLSLVPGATYLVESKSAGFASYDISIDASSEKNQDDSVSKIYHTFTYQGCSNFTLSNLSSEVKGKINRILSPNSSGTTVSNWRPTGGSFQTLLSLVPSATYLVESKSAGFASYSLDIPEKCEPPESSSDSEAGSSSTSVQAGSSSDSEAGSSSTSVDCSLELNLPNTLTGVLNSNQYLTDLYYAEDISNGWIVVSAEEIEFRYDSRGSDELNISTSVYLGDDQIATINCPPDYVGADFALVYRGAVYCGVISEWYTNL